MRDGIRHDKMLCLRSEWRSHASDLSRDVLRRCHRSVHRQCKGLLFMHLPKS